MKIINYICRIAKNKAVVIGYNCNNGAAKEIAGQMSVFLLWKI